MPELGVGSLLDSYSFASATKLRAARGQVLATLESKKMESAVSSAVEGVGKPACTSEKVPIASPCILLYS
jgi:hypothetical protein